MCVCLSICLCVCAWTFYCNRVFFAPAIISSLAIQCAIKSLTILQQLWILKWLPNTSSLPSLWLFGKFLVKYMIVCLFASTTASVVSGSKRITESKWNGAFLYKYYLLYFRFFFFLLASETYNLIFLIAYIFLPNAFMLTLSNEGPLCLCSFSTYFFLPQLFVCVCRARLLFRWLLRWIALAEKVNPIDFL